MFLHFHPNLNIAYAMKQLSYKNGGIHESSMFGSPNKPKKAYRCYAAAYVISFLKKRNCPLF